MPALLDLAYCSNRFIYPLFRSVSLNKKRIIKAACLLHDVSWRAHPDYRAEVCFDNATRANLGGLKHSERIFLGLALLHRYSNEHRGVQFQELCSLIDEKARLDALIVGKAMRFGSMLWMENDADRGELRWFPKKKANGTPPLARCDAPIWRSCRDGA